MVRETRYVIFDTDGGADDLWALLLLLKSEQHFDIKILAITCVSGNTTLDCVAVNTLRILELCNRTDIPVYKGANEAIIAKERESNPFHGNNGVGGLDLDNVNEKLIHEENAIIALHRLVTTMPGEITLICVGPLTNIALAIKVYPDFVQNVKEIFIMGGNFTATGNITSCAEYNFHTDPEAASIVLECLKCPITILPWEPCMAQNTDISMKWRLEVLGKIDKKIIKLMNAIDTAIYVGHNYQHFNPCDFFLMAVFVYPTVIKKYRECHASVELNGTHTRGQTIIDHKSQKTDHHNVKIIELIHSDIMKKLLLWTAGHSVEI